MKNLEKIKFICGLIMISFAILGGIFFYFESLGIGEVWYDLSRSDGFYWLWTGVNNGGSSNAPIFLGICGFAGAYLLASVKPVEKKSEKEQKFEEEEI